MIVELPLIMLCWNKSLKSHLTLSFRISSFSSNFKCILLFGPLPLEWQDQGCIKCYWAYSFWPSTNFSWPSTLVVKVTCRGYRPLHLAGAEPSLNLHWTFTDLHWTFLTPFLNLSQPSFTEPSLNLHWPSQNLHWTFTDLHWMNLHWTFTDLHWTFTDPSLNLHWTFTEP